MVSSSRPYESCAISCCFPSTVAWALANPVAASGRSAMPTRVAHRVLRRSHCAAANSQSALCLALRLALRLCPRFALLSPRSPPVILLSPSGFRHQKYRRIERQYQSKKGEIPVKKYRAVWLQTTPHGWCFTATADAGLPKTGLPKHAGERPFEHAVPVKAMLDNALQAVALQPAKAHPTPAFERPDHGHANLPPFAAQRPEHFQN